jgi:hyperosmotically inducible protein
MKSRFLMAAALLAGAAVAGAATKTDTDIAKSITHEVLTYPYYSIWDDIGFRVADGQVQLTGEVTQPVKKSDIEQIVRRTAGVTSVSDEIKVLPLSSFDDSLRRSVASAIYRDPVFTQYAMQALPPIHIIVENGHVTLDGIVRTDFEKQVAGVRASSAGLSFGPIVNNLHVEQPAKKS